MRLIESHSVALNIRAIVVTFPVLAKLTILVSSVARIIHPSETGNGVNGTDCQSRASLILFFRH
jgi:hypothetical protein